MPIFHKLRKAQFKTEGIKRYLLYAIGEIVLVVAGILIALEVNNWNEEKRERQMEKSLLANVLKGLIKDSTDLKFNLIKHSYSLNSQKIVIKWLESGQPFHDSLKHHLAIAHRFTQFISRESPFENLKNIGLRIISNDTLLEQISTLYDEEYDLYNEYENKYTRLVFNMMTQTNSGLFDVTNPVVFDAPKMEGAMTPVNPEKLQKNARFAHDLRTKMTDNEIFIHYIMIPAGKRVARVTDMIRRELRKN